MIASWIVFITLIPFALLFWFFAIRGAVGSFKQKDKEKRSEYQTEFWCYSIFTILLSIVIGSMADIIFG
jgi:hypothetical protein